MPTFPATNLPNSVSVAWIHGDEPEPDRAWSVATPFGSSLKRASTCCGKNLLKKALTDRMKR